MNPWLKTVTPDGVKWAVGSNTCGKYKFKDNYDEQPQMINWELDNDEHHAAIGHASAEERAECSDEVSEHV